MESGFLIIDKPSGITSFDVIRKLRKILKIKKMGHLGTLDPLANGVLVIALKEATKIIEFLMGADKTYEAEITFGLTSDTYDADGKIEENTGEWNFTQNDIESVIQKNFLGKIKQIPPKFSALKINGKRAYDLARAGKNVEIKEREVTIHECKILEYNWPVLKAEISCSSGTYIRSIANDLGQKLGCGGYLSALRRTRVGTFEIDDALDIDRVDEKNILPIEIALKDFPVYHLTPFEIEKIRNGQPILAHETFEKDYPIFLLNNNENCVGIGKYNVHDTSMHPKKIIHI